MFKLFKQSTELFTAETEPEVLQWLQNYSGFPFEYCFKFGGYKLVEIKDSQPTENLL